MKKERRSRQGKQKEGRGGVASFAQLYEEAVVNILASFLEALAPVVSMIPNLATPRTNLATLTLFGNSESEPW